MTTIKQIKVSIPCPPVLGTPREIIMLALGPALYSCIFDKVILNIKQRKTILQ